jgi:hypothetical protein
LQVVEASGLAGDIAAWANGDLFQAGENGQSLSGGQKARVGLARALYSRRPVMLVSCYWRRVTQSSLHIVVQLIGYNNSHGDERSFLLCSKRNATLQFDDPLSGLDATTKRKVFSEAIGPGSITADTGRILVTQSCMLFATWLHALLSPKPQKWLCVAVQHLPQCHRIVVMSEGRIIATGTFAELEAAKLSNPRLQVRQIGSIQ